MARIRYLKPEFFFDDDLAELDFASRLFFQGLWCYADREGRLEDKPKVLKAQIMPYDNVNVEKTLDKLNNKFIVRYEVEGRNYIQINNFIKHQKPHHTEKESVIPEFNGLLTVKSPSNNAPKEEDKEKYKIKKKNKEEDKEQYLDYVFLSQGQLKKLKVKFGDRGTEGLIENMNRYAHQIGEKKFIKKYDSHYHTILNWESKNNGQTKQPESKMSMEEEIDQLIKKEREANKNDNKP